MLDLGLKPHVEHSVCFIKDAIGYSFQICDAAVACCKNIPHTSWSAHYNLSAALEIGELTLHRHTAINSYHSDTNCFA